MAADPLIARLDKIDARLARWDDERDRLLAREVGLQTFMDELLRRHAGITRDMIGALAGLQQEIAGQRSQIQANTGAILRLLDERFGPEPPQG